MAINKEAALFEFVEENLDFLSSENATLKSIKSKRTKYFYDKHKNKFGSPSNKEIVKALIKILAKRGCPVDEIKSYINSWQIFKISGEGANDEYIGLLDNSEYKSQLPQETIQKIKDVGVFEAYKDKEIKNIQDAKEEVIEKFKQEIEEKQKEYESLPSILDTEEIPEPDFDPKLDRKKLWWERLYLRGNPFPAKDGLCHVNTEFYESVVIKTKPFTEVLACLKDDPNYLFNTGFLLAGGFGFGKTTYMDYLAYRLIHQNIIPIRISTVKPFPDSSGYVDDFLDRLKQELFEGCGKPTLHPSVASLEIDGVIVELSKRLLINKSGMVIMLDDYHKHKQKNQEIIFEFIGQLQMLKDKLVRSKVNVGFIVSGLPEWKEALRHDPQIAGFLDSPPIEMPKLTPQNICDAFNQRLEAYSYSSNPHLIKSNFIEGLFKNGGDLIGYRNYITTIQHELASNNWAILNTPIEITDEELIDIKQIIETYQSLKTAFNKLTLISRTKGYTGEIISIHLELLVHASLNNGIMESEPIFLENSFYFQKLNEVGLIQKQRLKSESHDFKWVLTEKLQKAAGKVRDKYKKEINDYLLKIYASKNYSAETPVESSRVISEIKTIQSFFHREDIDISESAMENIEMAFRLFETANTSVRSSDIGAEKSKLLIKNISSSIEYLSKAFFEIDQSINFFMATGTNKIEERWQQHWLDYEGLSEYFRHSQNYSESGERKYFEYVIASANEVFPYIAEKLKKTVTDICCPDASPFNFRHQSIHYTYSEYTLFEEVQDLYYSANADSHFKYVKLFSNYLETRFRLFFYVCGVLIFGEKDYFDYIPSPADKKYAHKNIATQSFSVYENLFCGFNRTQFRPLFCTKNVYKDRVLNFLNLNWHSDDFGVFFDSYAKTDITTKHEHKSEFSPKERLSYIKHISQGAQLLSSMNRFISGFIIKSSYLVTPNVNSVSPSDYIFRFATKLNNQGKQNESKILSLEQNDQFFFKEIAEHQLPVDTLNKISMNLEHKFTSESSFILDLMNVDFIVQHYQVPYSQFITCLSFLHFVKDEIEIYPWHGSSVLIKNK